MAARRRKGKTSVDLCRWCIKHWKVTASEASGTARALHTWKAVYCGDLMARDAPSAPDPLRTRRLSVEALTDASARIQELEQRGEQRSQLSDATERIRKLELEREEKKRLKAEAEQVTEILRFSRFSIKDSIYQNMFIRFLTRFPI